jgi:hypothetical protein
MWLAVLVVDAMADDLGLMLKTIATATNTLFMVLPSCYLIASLSTIAKVSFLLVGSPVLVS